ncbi:MAG: terpene cyclase/mutase family protein [Planctomycetes bacterium]|nr:terpene cyclase/mutase family protein [Planctomycetota bacterium]
MDTVTYPEDSVREAAAGFVCIRVAFDRRPDLVGLYKVEPLPDVRLLEPDGKEVAKLLGFSSPAKLVARMKSVLAGGTPGGAPARPPAGAGSGVGAAGGPATTVPPAEPTPAAVDAAVARGVAFLRAAEAQRWKEMAGGMGPEDLVLFTCASSGLDASDPYVDGLLRVVLQRKLAGIYQASLRALALARLGGGEGRREALEACARFLVESQLANGQWTYGPAAGAAAPLLGDNSNTAFALLGLAACRKAGVAVPQAVFDRAGAWWRGSQNADGGWGYRSDREKSSYASMTESGLSSLLLCGAPAGGAPSTAAPTAPEPAVARALDWLRANFAVNENRGSAYQEGRVLYHLFALERAGNLLGADEFAGHSWYPEGAAWLLATQREEGSWDDGAGTPVPNTCFALLFLRRAARFLR